MAGFLGCRVPVWDMDTVYTDDDHRSMLVISTRFGVSLAQALGGAGEGGRGELRFPVVLMRGHGMVVTASGIEMVVLRFIYTAPNARVQQSAMGLGGAVKLFPEKETSDTCKIHVELRPRVLLSPGRYGNGRWRFRRCIKILHRPKLHGDYRLRIQELKSSGFRLRKFSQQRAWEVNYIYLVPFQYR